MIEISGAADIPQGGSGAGLHVLLVEDSVVNQRVGKHLLESEGCSVAIAASGEEAIECLCAGAEHGFDLVVMDYHMPGLNGAETTAQVRAYEKGAIRRIPIIGVSATATVEQRHQCRISGMEDCLSKPYNIRHLRRILHHFSIRKSRRSVTSSSGTDARKRP
ncbi:MAG: response regulator [Bryobacteraceae bacterium]